MTLVLQDSLDHGQSSLVVRDSRVAVAGDWHRDWGWVPHIVLIIARADPTIRTSLYAGDFGLWPGQQGKGFRAGVDASCAESGIDDLIVTPGNHDDWNAMNTHFAGAPGDAIQLSDIVAVVPGGRRFEIGHTSFLSFGGAVSVDRNMGLEGSTWWRSEMPTVEDVAHAIEGGTVDVLISHDTVDGGNPAIDEFSAKPSWRAVDAPADSALSRAHVTRVWEETRPKLLMHGHLHMAAVSLAGAPNKEVSLGRDGDNYNVIVLDLPQLTWAWLPSFEPRDS